MLVEDIDVFGSPIPGARLTVCAPTTLVSHPADFDLGETVIGVDTTEPADTDADIGIVEVVEAERALWRMQFVPETRDDDTSLGRWWLVEITVQDTWPNTTECPPPPPPTTPPTTPAPTVPPTTTEPLTQDRLDVTTAAKAAFFASLDALTTFGSDEALERVDRHFVADSAARLEIDRLLQSMSDRGLRARLNPDVESSLTVEAIAFQDPVSPTQADLTVCIVEAGILYEPATDDLPETIANDTYGAGRAQLEMHKIDGQWQLANREIQENWLWETECPPAN